MHLPLSKMRILAVDDNRTNLHILQVFLKKLGHEVVAAENGEQAVAHFENERPDLVLLDIMMPIMDGFEAARRIRAMSADRWVPIIFLSALNRDENLLEGLEAGGDDYLTKPVNFIVLEAKMRSMQRALQLQQRAFDACRRLQALSDNMQEAMVTADGNAVILACNPATQALFGWPSEELVGQSIDTLLIARPGGCHDEAPAGADGASYSGDAITPRELAVRHRNGTAFPAVMSIAELAMGGQETFIYLFRPSGPGPGA